MQTTEMICWQYLIKKQLQDESQGNIPDFDEKKYNIRQINYKCAQEFILQYEWVGNMGRASICFGIFFNELLGSVVCFGPPVAPTSYKSIFGEEDSKHILQLCRGASAFWAPRWAPSKLLSSSLKMLNRIKNTQIVVTYSDPSAGEIGTIYQACNAYYFGMTRPGGSKKYIINGRTYDSRRVFIVFGSRAHDHIVKIDPNYSTIPVTPKHRYVFFLGTKSTQKRLYNKIYPFLKPYPKRSS
jgi:hypothetical protein